MVVNGIQSQGVMATSKHYVNNQQETNRHTISENLDERTEFEMYLPPFEAAVNAGTLAIMCSYNKINETWSCENSRTLGYLKETMGFKYFVMSDWGATHSTVESAFAGLDQEQPSDEYFGSALQANVRVCVCVLRHVASSDGRLVPVPDTSMLGVHGCDVTGAERYHSPVCGR